jgi:hypothetical protein
MVLMKSWARFAIAGNNIPVKMSSNEKTIEVIMIPIVSGNFKNRVLMYAKIAVITTRMVMMTKMLMKDQLVLLPDIKHSGQYTNYFPMQMHIPVLRCKALIKKGCQRDTLS